MNRTIWKYRIVGLCILAGCHTPAVVKDASPRTSLVRTLSATPPIAGTPIVEGLYVVGETEAFTRPNGKQAWRITCWIWRDDLAAWWPAEHFELGAKQDAPAYRELLIQRTREALAVLCANVESICP